MAEGNLGIARRGVTVAKIFRGSTWFHPASLVVPAPSISKCATRQGVVGGVLSNQLSGDVDKDGLP